MSGISKNTAGRGGFVLRHFGRPFDKQPERIEHDHGAATADEQKQRKRDKQDQSSPRKLALLTLTAFFFRRRIAVRFHGFGIIFRLVSHLQIQSRKPAHSASDQKVR